MNNLTLAGLAVGQTAQIRELLCRGRLRSRLLDFGLIPGTAVTCVHQGAGIAAYRVRGAVIALRSCDAVTVTLA
jgi:ferrous iron transport protein A